MLDERIKARPHFTPLVKRIAENFKIDAVSADKGYSGRDNFDVVDQAGGTAFIAFKENSTGGAGGLFEQMFHYYQFRREEFLQHYHKRSNVESTLARRWHVDVKLSHCPFAANEQRYALELIDDNPCGENARFPIVQVPAFPHPPTLDRSVLCSADPVRRPGRQGRHAILVTAEDGRLYCLRGKQNSN